MNNINPPKSSAVSRLTELNWTIISDAEGRPVLVFKSGTIELRPEGCVLALWRADTRLCWVPNDAVCKQTSRIEALVALAQGAREV